MAKRKRKRDNFTSTVIRALRERVNGICSNPNCRCFTYGPHGASSERAMIAGTAAHICAAAPKGPRYDASMTADERSSIENGIWLCDQCALLIDTDPSTYTVSVLKSWKQKSENLSTIRLKIAGNDFEQAVRGIVYFQDDLHAAGSAHDGFCSASNEFHNRLLCTQPLDELMVPTVKKTCSVTFVSSTVSCTLEAQAEWLQGDTLPSFPVRFTAFDGCLAIVITSAPHACHDEVLYGTLQLQLQMWNGHMLHALPHCDELLHLCRAMVNSEVKMTVHEREVSSSSVATISLLGVRECLATLQYIVMARTVAQFAEVHVPFSSSAEWCKEHYSHLEQITQILTHGRVCTTARGGQVVLQAQINVDSNNVATLSSWVQEKKALAVSVDDNVSPILTLFGLSVTLPVLRHTFMPVFLVASQSTPSVGESLLLNFYPADNFRAEHEFLSFDSPLCGSDIHIQLKDQAH